MEELSDWVIPILFFIVGAIYGSSVKTEYREFMGKKRKRSNE